MHHKLCPYWHKACNWNKWVFRLKFQIRGFLVNPATLESFDLLDASLDDRNHIDWKTQKPAFSNIFVFANHLDPETWFQRGD